MPYKKTVPKPDSGVDLSIHPYEITARSWSVMTQMRARQGRVTNFPGWLSILAPSSRLDGSTCSLVASYRQFDGTTFLLAGGAERLYRYVPGTQSLTDISGTTYGPTADNPWWGFFFLNNFYVTNLIDGLHKYEGVGNFQNVTGAPRARAGCSLNSYILLLNVIDADGEHHQRLQWCAEGSDSEWQGTSTNDAGHFDFTDTSDDGVALYRIGNDAVVYFEHSIIPITFVGGNEVFGARQTIEKIGLIGQNALANLGDRHIFMGNDAFYEYVGGVTINRDIGLKVRDNVYTSLHPVYKNRSKAMYLQDTSEVMFHYPSSGSEGDCDTVVVYNLVDKSWYGPFPLTATAVGTTVRGLTKVINQDNEIINLDNSPINVNTDLQTAPLVMFGDDKGDLMSIGEVQTANGAPLTRILETGDQPLVLDLQAPNGAGAAPVPGTVFQIVAVHLETESIAPNEPIQMFLGIRMELNDDITYKGPYTIYSFRTQKTRVPVRGTGRYARLRFVLPNSARLSLLGYSYELENMGLR